MSQRQIIDCVYTAMKQDDFQRIHDLVEGGHLTPLSGIAFDGDFDEIRLSDLVAKALYDAVRGNNTKKALGWLSLPWISGRGGNSDNETALSWAIKHENFILIDILLTKGADTGARETFTREQDTPISLARKKLIEAFKKNETQMALKWLNIPELMVGITADDFQGLCAIAMNKSCSSILVHALERASNQQFVLVVPGTLESDRQWFTTNEKTLFEAVERKNTQQISELSRSFGISASSYCEPKHGSTALHQASKDTELFMMLIQIGYYCPRKEDKQERTAIDMLFFYAIQKIICDTLEFPKDESSSLIVEYYGIEKNLAVSFFCRERRNVILEEERREKFEKGKTREGEKGNARNRNGYCY